MDQKVIIVGTCNVNNIVTKFGWNLLRHCFTIYICIHYLYIIEPLFAHHWLSIEPLFIHRWLNINTSFAHHCLNIEPMLKVWSSSWSILCQQGYIVVVLMAHNCINIYINCVNIASTLGQHWLNIVSTSIQNWQILQHWTNNSTHHFPTNFLALSS